MFNMAGQNQNKLNSLLAQLGDGWLAPTPWLERRGYARSLLSYYVKEGWLSSPARGVYQRAGSRPTWQMVVYSLQRLAGLPLHVGGSQAITLHGMDHYLRLGAATVTLFGPARLPAWVNALGLSEHFELRRDAKLGFVSLSGELLDSQNTLREVGLDSLPGDRPNSPIVASMPERALLELLLDVPNKASVAGVDAILQGATRLRPELLSRLLRDCHSVKVKRLFLALAERHGHAWFKHLDLEGVDLGSGNRVLGVGERLHPEYRITLPRDLDDQLV